MRAKIEKANHVVMFETAGEFYAHEVTQGILKVLMWVSLTVPLVE
ncbi:MULTISPECIES: hypothetical protein [Priestia]|nr:hypothetical protein [Priestia megaterium]MED5121633.1 hypothetical protein [Priestia megaterium]